MKTIAFIPVRGGSKSIPLKNIKSFCGKPLVCWNIEALEVCPEVDEVIVATDSDDIWNTVKSRIHQLCMSCRGVRFHAGAGYFTAYRNQAFHGSSTDVRQRRI